MTWSLLVRSELRKIATTKLPMVFLGIIVAIVSATATAILAGHDADGTKGFISSATDQQSLLAFGTNAMMGAGLFGAIAAAREYDHRTVISMFLVSPRRHQAMLAQYVALFLTGGLLGLAGGVLTIVAALICLPMVDFDFLLSAGAVIRILATAALAGGVGAVLGAGVGALVRNSAGAVTAAVLLLIIAPPLAVQFLNNADWVPSTVVNVISGVGEGPSVAASLAILAGWAVVPAIVALFFVHRRDVT